jgi:thiol-disulfide isomerase/thioredoxin
MRDRRRHLIRGLFLAPWALVPSAAVRLAQATATPPATGSKLPLVDLPLIEGGTFKAAEATGRVVVIYWWASWCPFCAEMTPHVEALWRAQRERGLIVLGISIDKSVEAPKAYRAKRGYTFPSALYESGLERLLPRPKVVPTTWVRDRKGRVAWAATGQLFPEDVAELARFL